MLRACTLIAIVVAAACVGDDPQAPNDGNTDNGTGSGDNNDDSPDPGPDPDLSDNCIILQVPLQAGVGSSPPLNDVVACVPDAFEYGNPTRIDIPKPSAEVPDGSFLRTWMGMEGTGSDDGATPVVVEWAHDSNSEEATFTIFRRSDFAVLGGGTTEWSEDDTTTSIFTNMGLEGNAFITQPPQDEYWFDGDANAAQINATEISFNTTIRTVEGNELQEESWSVADLPAWAAAITGD